MDEQQRLIIKSLLKNYPENSTSIDLLHTADFTDKEDIPSGIISQHGSDVVMHVDSFANNTFDYLVVCPILNSEKLNDEYFKKQERSINEAVPQYVSNPCSLKTKDSKVWSAELGENESSFAGIFKLTKGRDTTYYICAQAGAPVVCKEMREKLVNNKLTFNELLQDKDYNNAHYLALRNAQRLAYNVARAFKVGIRHEEDIGAKIETSYSGRPMRASPQYIQAISSIASLRNGNVGVFNKVTPVMENNNNYHFVYAGPYNGISMYYMNQKSIGHGLPSHSGRHNTSMPITGDLNKRCNGILCEKINAKDHPDVKQETYKNTEEESFVEGMKKLGWNSNNPVLHMIPVVIKIWDPTLKRKV